MCKKQWNHVILCNLNGTGGTHIRPNKSEKERQIHWNMVYIITEQWK